MTIRIVIGRVLKGVAVSMGLAASALGQTTTGVTDDEIVIGMFAPLSGPLAAYGTDPINAARAYFDDINTKGGIHGRTLHYLVEDDKCTPAAANTVVRKFITVEKVFLLLGGSCSGSTVSVQELVNQEKVPHFMLNASGDAGVYPPTTYQFGSAPGTQRATLAAVMMYAIEGLGAKSVGVLGPNDAMGTSALEMITAMAEKYDIKVVANEIVPNNATDVTVPVLNVHSANPDVIILTTYAPPTTLVMKKLTEFGLLDKPVISAIQGVSNTEAFVASPEPGIVGAYCFPHAMAIVDALERAGPDLTREAFMEAIDQTNLETGVMATPTIFAPGRRDSNRGQIIVKFDGSTVTRVGGPYTWDALIDPAVFGD